VTRYLLGGWSQESIARELGISHVSVKNSVIQLERLTGKRSMLAAVVYVLRTPAELEEVMKPDRDREERRRKFGKHGER
jgi:transposase-like protein